MRTDSKVHLLVAAAVLAVCGIASYAWADSTSPKAAMKEALTETDGKHQGEKDQTSFMGIKRYDLAIYTLIVFALLFVIMGKYAWKPVMDGLQKREDAILKARSDAETARSEAQKLLDEIKAQRAKATEENNAYIAQARKDSEAYRESEKARTDAEMQAERQRLKREIETARDQALQEIWDKTVQLAALVSTKALGRIVSEDDHRRLLDESLAELGGRIGLDKV